jgi:hypothetical protein
MQRLVEAVVVLELTEVDLIQGEDLLSRATDHGRCPSTIDTLSNLARDLSCALQGLRNWDLLFDLHGLDWIGILQGLGLVNEILAVRDHPALYLALLSLAIGSLI